MAWRPSTRSPMCVSPRSTAISVRPRTSRNSLARWAAPEPTMNEQRVAPGQDERYMRIALGLAAGGVGNNWPNPDVRRVIVQDGISVGRCWHPGGGQIGKEACRERVSQTVESAGGDVRIEKT